jgi:hypothetical protein
MVFASISIPNFSMWRQTKERTHLAHEIGMAVLPERNVSIFIFFVTAFGSFGRVGVLVTVPVNFIVF